MMNELNLTALKTKLLPLTHPAFKCSKLTIETLEQR